MTIGYKITLTIVAVLLSVMLHYIAILWLKNVVNTRKLSRPRSLLLNKAIRLFFVLFAIVVVVSIWQVSNEVWVFLTGMIGIIAIGFFAVWSILSNIVAGLFLFISDPFRVGSEIVLLPDDIRGQVQDLKLLFVVLEDKEGAVLHIPNNLFFQKVIKTVPDKEVEDDED